MGYKLTSGNSVIRLADGAEIPYTEGNRDYTAYCEWLAAGNMPEPYTEPAAPIPRAVTMRQARLALLQAGLLDTINQAVAAMPGAAGDAARITWEFSGEVQRDNPFVGQLAATLHLSEAQLDNLFMSAAAL